MIEWTRQQKEEIWRLWTVDQISAVNIAQRYGHLGVSVDSIKGLLHRIGKERDEEVDKDIERAGKNSSSKYAPTRKYKQRNRYNT